MVVDLFVDLVRRRGHFPLGGHFTRDLKDVAQGGQGIRTRDERDDDQNAKPDVLQILQFPSPLASRLSPLASRLSPLASRLSPLAFRLSPLAFRLSPLASRLSPFPSPVSPLPSPRFSPSLYSICSYRKFVLNCTNTARTDRCAQRSSRRPAKDSREDLFVCTGVMSNLRSVDTRPDFATRLSNRHRASDKKRATAF